MQFGCQAEQRDEFPERELRRGAVYAIFGFKLRPFFCSNRLAVRVRESGFL